jgi:hypothetical protein
MTATVQIDPKLERQAPAAGEAGVTPPAANQGRVSIGTVPVSGR